MPIRTRLGFLHVEIRRRLRPRPSYRLRYGRGFLFLSHDDYEIDWETLKTVLVDEPYPADYRDTIVLDVGAHKGYFGAYALEHGARTVISFEPERLNLELLEQSVGSYRKLGADWQIRAVAVGAEALDGELHVMGASWGHALHPPDRFAEYEIGVQSISVVPMAEVLDEAATSVPGTARVMVKLNIEGEECPTVLGTPTEAWASVSEVLVETHPWATCTADELAEHLERAGLTRVGSAHPRMLQLRR